MATARDRTPAMGSAVHDPDQLTLGGLDAGAAPRSARDSAAEAQAGAEAPGALREPPVCGEWSFDPDETPDARVALAATPARGTPALRSLPERERSAAQSDGSVLARRASGPEAARAASRPPTPATPLPALAELKSIHDAQPADDETALALSAALSKRGNIEGALAVLERTIAAGADGAMLHCARAAILSGRLRYDEAERELQRAQKLKPDDREVLLQQGILACRRAKWREAVDPLHRVVKVDPLSAQAHFYLGEAQNKLDRLGEALESYHRAAELDSGNWRAFKGVGIILDRMGRSGEAAEYYRRARDGQRG
ncbi:MAG: tetratricopeptide repeat protein [Gemmatimonadaceae bacterium]|nr:tetratricopeptide repeat protein [Gemmatimonadaceae bacterium]